MAHYNLTICPYLALINPVNLLKCVLKMALSLYHLFEGRIESLCLLGLILKKKRPLHSLPPAQKVKVENWKGNEALHTAVDSIQNS